MVESKEVFPDTGKKVEIDWIDQARNEYQNSASDIIEHFRDAIEKYMPKSTPPVTSTIEEVDIDKAVTKIWQLMFGACRTPQHPYNKELKEILSSLSPIQKKRTREYVWDSMK